MDDLFGFYPTWEPETVAGREVLRCERLIDTEGAAGPIKARVWKDPEGWRAMFADGGLRIRVPDGFETAWEAEAVLVAQAMVYAENLWEE